MDDYTPTYILTWNPNVYHWNDYEEKVNICKQGFEFDYDWSCRSLKPHSGDRFILLMQGMGRKNGIVGYGTIYDKPYELPFAGYGGRFIDIKFTKMWNYKTDKYVRTDVLKTMFPEQCFSPQMSGIRIRSSILPDLWRMMERT